MSTTREASPVRSDAWMAELARLGGDDAETPELRAVPAPRLEALKAAGTRRVYGDTADAEQLGRVLAAGKEEQLSGLDGVTINQPLLQRVLESLLDDGAPAPAAAQVLQRRDAPTGDRLEWIYAVLAARAGNRTARRLGGSRPWEVSLQLHMRLVERRADAVRVGGFLRATVPDVLVKVPFSPAHPQSLLAARELERAGVPVNLTSTFSARQVALAALFVGATRTNVFLGRIEQGLDTPRLGERVVLEAQRGLAELRARHAGLDTLLIAASLREAGTIERLAGCDAFTAPPEVLGDFLEADGDDAPDLTSRLEERPEPEVPARVAERLGAAGVERLWRVEPELVEFLEELDARPDPADGEELAARFETAGFGDLFHSPTAAEREEARAGKLPDLDGALVHTTALDTHYSLLANADFEKHQEEIDAAIRARL